MSKRHLIASALCAVLLAVGGLVLPPQADAGGGGGCVGDFQCNDNNTCTRDFCLGGLCGHASPSCDDGNSCTDDRCQNLVGCVSTAITCDDGNECTMNTCDPQSGCAFPPGGCDDNDDCTDEVCTDGSTCSHFQVNCDDNDDCTADFCQTVGGCGHTPITVGACAGTPVAGSRLRVDDVGSPRGRRNAATLSGAAIDLTGLDPTVTGATAIVGQPGGPSATIDLPANGWTKRGTRSRADYKFKSDTGDGVLAARVREGRSIRFSAREDGVYGLGGTPQGTLGVVFEIGTGRFCGEFGGTVRIDDGSHFFAVGAPTPANCPDLGH